MKEVVFRPRAARIFSYAMGALVWGGLITVAIILPSTGDQAYGMGDRLLFVLLGVPIFWFCHRHASVCIKAGEKVEVRNLLKSRTLDWAELFALRFPEGDGWAHFDLSDGTTLPVMAFQRSDGKWGIQQAKRFQELLNERTDIQ